MPGGPRSCWSSRDSAEIGVVYKDRKVRGLRVAVVDGGSESSRVSAVGFDSVAPFGVVVPDPVLLEAAAAMIWGGNERKSSQGVLPPSCC